MGNVTPIVPDDWDDRADDVPGLVLIPAAEYAVAYVSHHYAKIYGGHKACAICEITQGDLAGTRLACSYNVRFANKRYRPPLTPHAYYRIDMAAITGSATANLNRLRGIELIASVVTVAHDSNGRCRSLQHHYSRIQRLRKA